MPLRTLQATARHPFEVFLMALSVVSGIPILAGNIVPGSVEDALPVWGVKLWGGGLTLGAIVALVGIAMTRPNPKAHTVSVTGMVTEQVGVVIVGGAAMVYATCAIAYVGQQALFPSTIVMGYSISCFWRWVQIQRMLSLEHELQVRDQIIEEMRRQDEENGGQHG